GVDDDPAGDLADDLRRGDREDLRVRLLRVWPRLLGTVRSSRVECGGVLLDAHIGSDEGDDAGFGEGEEFGDPLWGRTIADAGDEALEPAADLHVDAHAIDVTGDDEFLEQQPGLPQHGEQSLLRTAGRAGQRIAQ